MDRKLIDNKSIDYRTPAIIRTIKFTYIIIHNTNNIIVNSPFLIYQKGIRLF